MFPRLHFWRLQANAAMPWSNPVIGQLAALLVRTGAASQADAWIEKQIGYLDLPAYKCDLIHSLSCGPLIKIPAEKQTINLHQDPSKDTSGGGEESR